MPSDTGKQFIDARLFRFYSHTEQKETFFLSTRFSDLGYRLRCSIVLNQLAHSRALLFGAVFSLLVNLDDSSLPERVCAHPMRSWRFRALTKAEYQQKTTREG